MTALTPFDIAVPVQTGTRARGNMVDDWLAVAAQQGIYPTVTREYPSGLVVADLAIDEGPGEDPWKLVLIVDPDNDQLVCETVPTAILIESRTR